MKHTNLATIRWYAAMFAAKDMPGTADMLNDMASEIEAWRDRFTDLQNSLRGVPLPLAAESTLHACRTILPPKESTDG